MALRLLAAGQSWEGSFEAALKFLNSSNGTLVLGPALGDSARSWIEDRYLSEENPVRFGLRIQSWRDWYTARARDEALSHGRGFRTLNTAAKREHLRVVAEAMASNNAFHHLQGIWKEEKFFAALLGCVDEAREAGLLEPAAIARAQDLLKNSGDETAREAYSDFWHLLLIYEQLLSGNDPRLDSAALLRLAAENSAPGTELFFLGFDHLTLLETEVVKRWALVSDLTLALALSSEKIAALRKERLSSPPDLPMELSLRGLLTGFSGEVEQLSIPEQAPLVGPRRFLEAHSAAEEARAAAALARAVFDEFDEIRVVVPKGYFDDRSTAHPFREELGLPENFRLRKAPSEPVSRLFFHLLSIKDKNYSLAHGLEIAKLLEFTKGDFSDLASRAARAGVRKGLGDWQRKAGSDPELKRFAEFLAHLDQLLPSEATMQEFARVAGEVAKEVGLADLALRAPDLETERDAHAALSGVLRNAQMLAVSSRADKKVSIGEWIQELKVALSGSSVGDVLSFFPKIQFFEYGQWLPPSTPKTLSLALGLSNGVGPGGAFQFYLEEGARRRLSELLLPTQVQQGLGFLDQVRRLSLLPGKVIFSFSRHDDMGGELEPSWVSGTLPLQRGAWPEVAREYSPPPMLSVENVKVPGREISFSASFFELYKECPFKAFAEKVLRLEDKVQESALDLSRLEEGSFVHKVLELFYGAYNGKELLDPDARATLLHNCVEEAAQKLRVEYFKGNEGLLEAQKRRLERLLLEFLRIDGENYSRFPFFGKPELEKEVTGSVGGFTWKGKVDRVDYDEVNRRFLVTDYKIGASPPENKEINELRRFQLQLYLDAVETEKPGWSAIGGVYSSVTSGRRSSGLFLKEFNSGKTGPKPGEVKYFKFGPTSRGLHERPAFEDLRARTRDEAARLARAASSGDFPVAPYDEENSCKRCSVRPACRIRALRSPHQEPWPRRAPDELKALLTPPEIDASRAKKEKRFNPEQRQALEKRGELVFIEASAGTGKTTVIVERIRLFLEEKMNSEAAHLAVERFRAISFTEKSAQELAVRAAAALLEDPRMGPAVAASAQSQIGTIHGFCRKVIGDFPLEAGVSPLASMLDQKGSEALLRETIEDFFLDPTAEAEPHFEALYAEFPRAKIEDLLVKLLQSRLLYREEIEKFRAGTSDERVFSEGASREVLLRLLSLSDLLSAAYQRKKQEFSALDFNDLEELTLKVLDHEHARDFYRRKFELLLVDEFQDTNSVQREIFEKIARPGWANLFVVGDAKQSIYRFRAADVSVFQDLRRKAEGNGSLVTLGRNYRSSREIVEAANRITSAIFPSPGETAASFEAFDSPAIAELPAGGKVTLVEYGSVDDDLKASERRSREAELVAKLVSDLKARKDPPKSIAILLRKFSGNEAFLSCLKDRGIPFRVGASKGFYGQSLVTDSIALLRVLYGAKNDIALLATLRSPWFRLSDSAILEIQRRGEPSLPLFDKLKESEAPWLFSWKGYSTHSSLAGVLERAFIHYPMGRRDHLQAVKLLSIVDSLESEGRPRAEILDLLSGWSGWDQENEAVDDSIMPEPAGEGLVQVMTVHAAKGLEFDVTILADLCGKIPHDQSALRMVRGAGMVLKLEGEDSSDSHSEVGRLNMEREVAELKRLFYVAVTRAKREEYFFLPRSFGAQDRSKWGSCAHFLLAADLSGLVEKVNGDSWQLESESQSNGASEIPAAKWPSVPSHNLFRSSSITEIADYNTCPEFHRRKNVQHWDDQIVELWKKPPNAHEKVTLRRKRTQDPEAERVARLLKRLKIERKERGIALHRVLERVKDRREGLELARVWLREAYEAQGVKATAPELEELLGMDLDRISRFLSSAEGERFFNSAETAFPEISFEWKLDSVVLHGAIDRLIKHASGTWSVVDYKSSIQEAALEDYRFQVASYMAAVWEYARARGEAEPHVTGYLVDLFTATSISVDFQRNNARQQLREKLENTARNYTPAVTKPNLVESGIKGGDHCFSCPYSLHCEIGKRNVLAFP